MNTNKIKLLDNYQLYQLMQSTSIDKSTLAELTSEYKSRNISPDEVLKIKNRYALQNSDFNSIIEGNTWNPIITAFAINKHFRHLAILKTQGKKVEAKSYMIKLYIGLMVYFVLFIALLFLLKSN